MLLVTVANDVQHTLMKEWVMEAKNSKNTRRVFSSTNLRQSKPLNQKPSISRQRAALLVAAQQSLEDREDLFDTFCIFFGFNSDGQIESFSHECKLYPKRPQKTCENPHCNDEFDYDDGYRENWCCADCFKQSSRQFVCVSR